MSVSWLDGEFPENRSLTLFIVISPAIVSGTGTEWRVVMVGKMNE